jgi:hypothetical protein
VDRPVWRGGCDKFGGSTGFAAARLSGPRPWTGQLGGLLSFAVELAANGLPRSTYRETCLWTVDKVLESRFWPNQARYACFIRW